MSGGLAGPRPIQAATPPESYDTAEGPAPFRLGFSMRLPSPTAAEHTMGKRRLRPNQGLSPSGWRKPCKDGKSPAGAAPSAEGCVVGRAGRDEQPAHRISSIARAALLRAHKLNRVRRFAARRHVRWYAGRGSSTILDRLLSSHGASLYSRTGHTPRSTLQEDRARLRHESPRRPL